MIFDGETLCEEHYALKHIGVDSEVLNYCALIVRCAWRYRTVVEFIRRSTGRCTKKVCSGRKK